ncbi:MAG: hypothetical protein H0X24_01220 [Ktedonobacterales bacterium]|nr:hypothetical protein [Ktedonobacterales bacterium]
MDIQIFVLDGGQIQIMVDGPEVSFADAAQATANLIARLQALGFPIEQTSAIEQHKAGVEHVHVTGAVHVEH